MFLPQRDTALFLKFQCGSKGKNNGTQRKINHLPSRNLFINMTFVELLFWNAKR
jgi:hypothetical protein